MTALVDSIRYNALPSIEEANIARQAPFIDNVINGPVRDVFLKHAAHLAFCLFLQHRHHTIGVGETMVKVDGTAHLMDSQVIEHITSLGNKVVPTTWMTSGDNILPMEFAVAPASSATSTPTPAFISDLLSVLASNGCEGLFGVDTVAKSDLVEMTTGHASFVVPGNGNLVNLKGHFIPVAFTFNQVEPKFRVHKACAPPP